VEDDTTPEDEVVVEVIRPEDEVVEVELSMSISITTPLDPLEELPPEVEVVVDTETSPDDDPPPPKKPPKKPPPKPRPPPMPPPKPPPQPPPGPPPPEMGGSGGSGAGM
jgi:hypothetical protein